MPLKKYQGELDNVDPIALGMQLFREGKHVDRDTDPTDQFELCDTHGDFLYAFYQSMERGWYKARKMAQEAEFLAQLPAFQQSLPAVGSHTFVEFPNNPGHYFEYVVEYIPPERDQILLRAVKPKTTAYPGQSPLTLIGYEYPGRFPRFFTQPPAPTNGEASESATEIP